MAEAAVRARANELRAEAEKILADARREDRLEALTHLPEGWEERAAAEFIDALKRGDDLGQVKYGPRLWISFAASATCLPRIPGLDSDE